MGMTHDSLAVQAFKREHGRAPMRSMDHRRRDEAWIQNWKAAYVAQRVRQDDEYARYHVRRTTWRSRKTTRLRLKAALKEPLARP
jgi:hypothetical protein